MNMCRLESSGRGERELTKCVCTTLAYRLFMPYFRIFVPSSQSSRYTLSRHSLAMSRELDSSARSKLAKAKGHWGFKALSKHANCSCVQHKAHGICSAIEAIA